MPRTRCYRNGVLTDEDFPVEDVSEHLAESSSIVWIDLCAPDVADLQLVADELGLHRLAVEDAAEGRQRPKLDRYGGHDFLSAYSVRLDVETGQLDTDEIAAFITPSALVTVRQDDSFPIERLVERWDESLDLTKYGVGALLHGLLDFVIDIRVGSPTFGVVDAVRLDDVLREAAHRLNFIATGSAAPTRCTTTTCSMEGVSSSALSALPICRSIRPTCCSTARRTNTALPRS